MRGKKISLKNPRGRMGVSVVGDQHGGEGREGLVLFWALELRINGVVKRGQ